MTDKEEFLQKLLDRRAKQIKIILTWLEQNQPDVFSRGLWDALNEETTDLRRRNVD